MATQYNSIIRLKKIDECLRNRNKKYGLPDLIKAIGRELEKYGKQVKVSERTVYDDLKFLKDKYGPFEAPIERTNEKGYFYKDGGYSIFNPPTDGKNTEMLKSSIATLRQVSNMKGFEELKNILFRMEASYNFDNDKLTEPIVFIEEGLNISAQKYIEPLKDYIKKKEVLSITYQPFGKDPYPRIISPYYLKEYNNRWFLFGHQHALNKDDYFGTTNIPLDRINFMKASFKVYHENEDLNMKAYFNDFIGVSDPQSEKVDVIFKVYGNRKYYVSTKKIHKSQTTLEVNNEFDIFSVSIKPNKEMYSHFLGFGGDLEIIKPMSIRDKMKQHIESLSKRYEQ